MANVLLVAQKDPVVLAHAKKLINNLYITRVCAAWLPATMDGMFQTLSKGDTLYIIGHGNPSKLGGYSPSQMASMLAKAELPSGVAIELVACNSGTGGAPFALELKIQLVQNKILPNGVSGGKGFMKVSSTGVTLVRRRGLPKVPASYKPSGSKGVTYSTTKPFNF